MTDWFKGLWSEVKTDLVIAAGWARRKLLAPGIILIIVAVALVLVSMGFKELQIGGLVGKLLGRKAPEKGSVGVANTIPTGRVDGQGNLIPIGQADTKGDVQVQVVPIKAPGLFSDPQTAVFTDPQTKKPDEVSLPDGVKNTQVDQVVIIRPNVLAVTVKDGSGMSAHEIDDLIKKYGG